MHLAKLSASGEASERGESAGGASLLDRCSTFPPSLLPRLPPQRQRPLVPWEREKIRPTLRYITTTTGSSGAFLPQSNSNESQYFLKVVVVAQKMSININDMERFSCEPPAQNKAINDLADGEATTADVAIKRTCV